jgi:hypothetical protein
MGSSNANRSPVVHLVVSVHSASETAGSPFGRQRDDRLRLLDLDQFAAPY